MNGCLHSGYTEGLAKVGSEVQEVKGPRVKSGLPLGQNRKGHAVAAWQMGVITIDGRTGYLIHVNRPDPHPAPSKASGNICCP